MSKTMSAPALPALSDAAYDALLYKLQVQLVKLQAHVIKEGLRICIVVEGRDGAGKDGTIKRIVEHLSPRETRVVALPKPSDRETTQWYFQRFVPHLPAAGEIVLFNRSWYNRAGVEPVMGFCTKADHEEFLIQAPQFESLLAGDGVQLVKYYLDISRSEQAERLAERRKNPLKQWKVSPIDAAAQKKWKDYSRHRDVMFARTSHALAPWTIVRADNKKVARTNIIRDLLSRFDFKEKDEKLARADPLVVFRYTEDIQKFGLLAS